MTISTPLKSTTAMIRLTPAEKANIERKAALYTARTGRRLTLSEVLRQGAASYVDDLLRDTDPSDLDDLVHA
jgi:hypothetical protein